MAYTYKPVGKEAVDKNLNFSPIIKTKNFELQSYNEKKNVIQDERKMFFMDDINKKKEKDICEIYYYGQTRLLLLLLILLSFIFYLFK